MRRGLIYKIGEQLPSKILKIVIEQWAMPLALATADERALQLRPHDFPVWNHLLFRDYAL
jgi:hypothetical protein